MVQTSLVKAPGVSAEEEPCEMGPVRANAVDTATATEDDLRSIGRPVGLFGPFTI